MVTKNAAGLLPPRSTLELAGPGLEAPRCQVKKSPSGRSQRGDSARNKTLDHLLSLIDGIPNIGRESVRVKAGIGPKLLEEWPIAAKGEAVETARAAC